MVKTAEQPPAETPQLPAQVPEVTSILAEAARNPEISVEKLNGLVALQERVMDRQAEMDFANAMARFQALKETVGYNTEGQGPGGVSFGYTDYPTMVSAVTPWMAECGLSFTHRQDPPVFNDQGEVTLIMMYCIIRHASGHSESFPFPAIPDARLKGKVSPVQLIQLARTYAKRQSLSEGLGIATGEDRRDEDAIVHLAPLTEQQLVDLRCKVQEVGADEARFLKHFKAESLEALPAQCFADAIAQLEAYGKQRKKT